MATTQSTDGAAGPDAANAAVVATAAIGAALTIAAFALYSWRASLSVGLGATIAVANLAMMRAIIRALLRPPETEADAEPDPSVDHRAEGKRGGAAWGAFAVVKILVLFGGIWILLTRGLVDPMPLVVGYGALPIGIAASSLLTALAPRSRAKK